MRWFALIAVIALVMGCKKGEDSSSSGGVTTSAVREPAAKLSAIELFNEYQKNPIAADEKYKGKFVEVTGSAEIKQGQSGSYYAGFGVIVFPGMTQAQLSRLSTREQQWFRDGGYPPNVIAHIAPFATSEAAKISPGQQVSATGTVKGTRKANVWRDFVVELDNCLVKPFEPAPKAAKTDPPAKGKK